MGLIKTSLTVLLVSLCCSCSSSRDTNSTPPVTDSLTVSQSIAYHFETPSNASPELRYSESWHISAATMTITRNGGTGINSGAWTIALSQDEIKDINAYLTLIMDPAVVDSVYGVTVDDGPITNLFIGGDMKEFHHEMVTDPITNVSQWHEFPAEVSDFVAYIDQLMTEHIGDRYN
jgi:hypothetical protein